MQLSSGGHCIPLPRLTLIGEQGSTRHHATWGNGLFPGIGEVLYACKEYLRIARHITVTEAAEMLGDSKDRVLQHIKVKRLPGRTVVGRSMIALEAVERLKLNPPAHMEQAAGLDIQVRPG